MTTSKFHLFYQKIAITRNGEAVSPALKPLLAEFHDALLQHPLDLSALKESIIDVLSFLSTPEGRTNANCWAVDLFTMLVWDEIDTDIDLPEPYSDLLTEMGGALHDTVSYPEIAENLIPHRNSFLNVRINYNFTR